jgi:hypothetical protein
MPRQTRTWRAKPWPPRVITSLDPAVIPAGSLTEAKNIITGINDSLRKRPGIDKNWDDVTSATDAIIGGGDFWYLSGGIKTQNRVAVDATGAWRSYTAGGVTASLTVDGVALTAPTIASTINNTNLFIAAFDGSTNRIKKWDGTNNVTDLLSKLAHTSVSRASSGTTRTLVLDNTFKGAIGDYIVITDGPSDYNGTFAVTAVSTTTATNDTVQYTGDDPLTETTAADTSMTIQGLAPHGSILAEHQGRLLTNDKDRPYRLHYSAPGDGQVWGGYGDSGAIDISPNDGDPEGITAIFPTFNGDLFVAKRTKLYRIRGIIPDYSIEKVSDSIGCIGHQAVAAVDQSDIIFVSERGIHSLAATDKYGDYEQSFISADIQDTFNDVWERRGYIKASYLNNENLIAFAVTEGTGATNDTLWLYNVSAKARGWIGKWDSLPCESIFTVKDGDRRRWYLGADTTRVYKTLTDALRDTDEAGADSAIALSVTTGIIIPEDRPENDVGFKNVLLYYTPRGNQTITAAVKIDKFTSQSVSFDQGGGGTTLASFILGVDTLGSEGLFAAYTRRIDGRGRGAQITLTESSVGGNYSIEGIGLEYAGGGRRDEALQPDAT